MTTYKSLLFILGVSALFAACASGNLRVTNQPSQVLVDNTRRKLYVSDSGNGRIRRVDLLTGYVDTIIGKGVGAGNIEIEDPRTSSCNRPEPCGTCRSSRPKPGSNTNSSADLEVALPPAECRGNRAATTATCQADWQRHCRSESS